MFKLLHVWSSKEAIGNEKKNVMCWKKKFSWVLQCKTGKKMDEINFNKFIWVTGE